MSTYDPAMDDIDAEAHSELAIQVKRAYEDQVNAFAGKLLLATEDPDRAEQTGEEFLSDLVEMISRIGIGLAAGLTIIARELDERLPPP